MQACPSGPRMIARRNVSARSSCASSTGLRWLRQSGSTIASAAAGRRSCRPFLRWGSGANFGRPSTREFGTPLANRWWQHHRSRWKKRRGAKAERGAGVAAAADAAATVTGAVATNGKMGPTSSMTGDVTEKIPIGMKRTPSAVGAGDQWLSVSENVIWPGIPAGQPAKMMDPNHKKPRRSNPQRKWVEIQGRSFLHTPRATALVNGRENGAQPWRRSCRAASMLQCL
mmetsp:Transcript_69225/g.152793  ORF Transcript_69225/g.152793 Transcript_69225/m.152793 type:complete len:228 (-) Transcript_69225:154-837(-)